MGKKWKGSEVMDSQATVSVMVGGGGTAVTYNGHHLCVFQSAGCILLPFVITNVLISAFYVIMLPFIHYFVTNRNEMLYADGGLFVHYVA
jgi:hypothetical protein